MNYESMKDEELLKAIHQMEDVLKTRRRVEMKNAETEIKELITRYQEKNIAFYIDNGIGRDRLNTADIFCDESRY